MAGSRMSGLATCPKDDEKAERDFHKKLDVLRRWRDSVSTHL